MSFASMRYRLRQSWIPSRDWTSISTIDMHTGGEPLRVILDGLPLIPGETVLEKRRFFQANYDYLRTGLMFEPRGHADMYGAVVTSSREADFDVFFLHNEGYSTMCGHAIIALSKLVVESNRGAGLDVSFSVPAGRVESVAVVKNGRVVRSSFRNVPSFLYLRDQVVSVENWGAVRFDVAYGGAFYAVVDAESLGLRLEASECQRLIDAGRSIKKAISKTHSVEHPFESDLGFLYGTIFTGPARDLGNHSRNVCIFADGEVDRSATGSGVSARAALHYAKGELSVDEPMRIEGILGTTMTVRIVDCCQFGPYAAVIPEVGGTASITGYHKWLFDPEDPLRHGFIFR